MRSRVAVPPCLHELEDALFLAQPSGEENVLRRRLRRLTDVLREGETRRYDLDPLGASARGKP
jgi:hypothetical protein